MTTEKYDDLMTELAWFMDEWNPNGDHSEWDETPIAVGIPNVKEENIDEDIEPRSNVERAYEEVKDEFDEEEEEDGESEEEGY